MKMNVKTDYESEIDDWDNNDESQCENKISEDSLLKVKDYVFWSSDQIEQRQKKWINQVVELLGISEDDAITALRHYNWNPEKLQESWFSSEEKTREICWLTPAQFLVSWDMEKQDIWYIWYRKLKKDKWEALKWGHFFCSSCWIDYFQEKLSEGYRCVFATCPYYKCPLAVTHEMWMKQLKDEDKFKYIKFHHKSYTDDTKNIKWWPSPGCPYWVEDISYSAFDVKWEWGYTFWFKWNQDSHLPCNWEIAMKWTMKNKSENENITWIIANTKNCPKCQRPIEKNQGCNHMTCKMCKYEFWWMWMGDWKEHGSSTGGYYYWNKYEYAKKSNTALSSEEEKREKAKNELKKYMFFYQRYNNHMKAYKLALEMEPSINSLVNKLNKNKHYPIEELDFLKEALTEVIHCRNVLKWTYVYGYYLEDGKEKHLFE
jgi:ariadne-1